MITSTAALRAPRPTRKFPNMKPDGPPASDQMVWLSRGLFEALTGFIAAAGADASDYKLRAMLYEFRTPPVGRAFKAAKNAGPDVAIRYEAQSYKDENETMIAGAGIKSICKPQKSRAGIRHNKFIVLIHKGTPVAVDGLHEHLGEDLRPLERGHAIWDQGVAQRFRTTGTCWPKLTSREPLGVANGRRSHTGAEIRAARGSDADPLLRAR